MVTELKTMPPAVFQKRAGGNKPAIDSGHITEVDRYSTYKPAIDSGHMIELCLSFQALFRAHTFHLHNIPGRIRSAAHITCGHGRTVPYSHFCESHVFLYNNSHRCVIHESHRCSCTITATDVLYRSHTGVPVQ